MNPSSSSSSSRLPTRIRLSDETTLVSEVTKVSATPTQVSLVTKADQVKDESQMKQEDISVEDEPLEKDLSDGEMALLVAKPKMTARQQARAETGRNRRRGGQNQDYYAKWAWVKKPLRKHQCN